MSVVLTKEDFQTVRSLIRWTGLGALPAKDRAISAAEVIAAAQKSAGKMFPSVSSVVEEMCRGVMSSQAACQVAERELNDAYRRPVNEDGYIEVERPHA